MSGIPPSNVRVAAGLSRREAFRRILVVSALVASRDLMSFAAEGVPGIGLDPNLLTKEIPWPRILTQAEKAIVTALGDIIIPADEFGPAASAVGVPDFIDEWVSAPYEQQMKDLGIIRKGLAWIDTESQRRYGNGFVQTKPEQQTAILTDITTEGTEARQQALSFFRLFRDRVAGGYYSTPAGWQAIGYTGNTPQLEFAGPPDAALKHVGLA
jgi:hypothetical protein